MTARCKCFSHNGFLTRLGIAFMESERAAEMYVDELVDGQGEFQYLDSVGSVSALGEGEDASVQPGTIGSQSLP